MTTDITAAPRRRASLKAVDVIIATILARFPEFTPSTADAWKQAFIDALVGYYEPPPADVIEQAAKEVFASWKWPSWPKPAEFGDKAHTIMNERRADRKASEPLQISNVLKMWNCNVCGDKGQIAMYRYDKVNEQWDRRVFECDHLHELCSPEEDNGWRTLRYLTPVDRNKALGDNKLEVGS